MLTRVELYAMALRRQGQLQRALGAVTGGVFLGLLDREHRAQLDAAHYDGASELVDGVERAYADEAMVHSGLFGWESKAIGATSPPAERWRWSGAGAGREVLALLEGGFDAHGFEPHPRLAQGGGRRCWRPPGTRAACTGRRATCSRTPERPWTRWWWGGAHTG